MNILFDIILIIIFAFFIFRGYKKGFVKTVLKLSAGIIALIVALALSSPLSDLLYDKVIYSSVREPVYTSISSAVEEHGTSALYSADGSVGKFDALLEKFDTSRDDILGSSLPDAEQKADELCEKLSDGISSVVAGCISHMLAFAVIFVVVFIAVRLLSHFSGAIRKIPFVGTADGILGGVLGACIGFIALLLITVIFNAAFSLAAAKDPTLSVYWLDKSIIVIIMKKIDFLNIIL